MAIEMHVTGAAALARLSGSMTSLLPGVGGTITVDTDAGWPLTGHFAAVIDRGLPNEESVLFNSRVGTTWTVGQRGYDGTAASDHDPNAAIELDLPAVTVQALIDHENGTAIDPHSTTLLNNTRHDVQARHTFGAAFAAPGAPPALTPDNGGSAGVAAGPARSDHTHNVPAATAGTITGVNAEGTSGSFARADHDHALGGLIVGSGNLAADAVIAGKIAAGAISQSTDFGAGVVDSGALGAAAVIAGKVAAGGVSATNQLADAIITLAKFASEAGTNYGGAGAGSVGPWTNTILGTGGLTYARHYKLGRIVIVFAGIQLGTGGDFSGPMALNLPFNAASVSGFGGSDAAVGGFVATRAWNQLTSVRVSGTGVISTTQALNFVAAFQASTWSFDQPFDWSDAGSGSKLQLLAVYEATA